MAEERAGDGASLLPGDVAQAIRYLLTQPRSAWIEEMNLWPFRGPD